MDTTSTTSTTSKTTLTAAQARLEAFYSSAAELAEFYATHGRLPVQCDAPDPHERKLGDFLRTARRSLTLHRRGVREGTIKERVQHLDEILPQWRTENTTRRTARTENRVFDDRVHALAQFVDKHRRLPSGASGTAKELALAKFVDNVRQARKGRGTMLWTPEREALLNEKVPGWQFSAFEVEFELNLLSLKEFIALHRHTPRSNALAARLRSGDQQHENELAVFVSRSQRSAVSTRRERVEAALAA